MARPDGGVARRTFLGGLALAPALLALGCAPGRGPAYEPVPEDVAATVDLRLMSFEPEEVRIRAGESVLWRNRSAFTHTVTGDPARSENVRLPDGAAPFHSGDLPPGEVFRHRFEVAGEYRYVCMPHSPVGMGARVVVEPPAA